MNCISGWIFSKTDDLPAYPADLNPSTRSMPEANKWILSEFVAQKLVPVVGIHPYPLDELLLMCATMAYFKPDAILEWGTYYGKSARIFYEAATYLHLGTKIHSIDLAPDQEHDQNIHDAKRRGAFVRGLPVKLHLGDGLMTARKVLTEIKPRLPLFFVDGDHSFESVWKELNGIKEMSARAVILVHDVFYQGDESGYNCGPYEALSKFTSQYRLPFQSTILGLPGMGLTYWLSG